jgi:hypothetical protein
MDDLWVFMKTCADTVAAEFANDRKTGIFGVLLDGVADVPEPCAGRTCAIPSQRHSKVMSHRRLA